MKFFVVHMNKVDTLFGLDRRHIRVIYLFWLHIMNKTEWLLITPYNTYRICVFFLFCVLQQHFASASPRPWNLSSYQIASLLVLVTKITIRESGPNPGACGGNRTRDLAHRMPWLYPLSHGRRHHLTCVTS